MTEKLLFWSIVLNVILVAVIAMLLVVFLQVTEDCRRDARGGGGSCGFVDYTGRDAVRR